MPALPAASPASRAMVWAFTVVLKTSGGPLSPQALFSKVRSSSDSTCNRMRTSAPASRVVGVRRFKNGKALANTTDLGRLRGRAPARHEIQRPPKRCAEIGIEGNSVCIPADDWYFVRGGGGRPAIRVAVRGLAARRFRVCRMGGFQQ